MALNEFMHPRNPYKNKPPDFNELADRFTHFKKYVTKSKAGKPFVNFRNPQAVRNLAVCLFEKDFDLKVELPDDRLAPTLPLRLNYLLWLEDLMNCTTSSPDKVTILDVGCGSSCVYPLLGCRINPNWNFVATEIDEKNLSCAETNVKTNDLSDRIKIKHVNSEGPLIADLEFDVCMCNPPFFTNDKEATASADRPTANSSCAGNSNETVGGDYSYAEKMLKESLRVEAPRLWYTIMLGKKSSFVALKKLLHKSQVKTTAFTQFCQGRTMRWGVAWSFMDHDTTNLVQPKPKKPRKAKPLSFDSKFTSVNETLEATKDLLENLSIDFEQEEHKFKLKGNISAALPSRKDRRKQQKQENSNGEPSNKKMKLNVDSSFDSFECHMIVVPVDFAPARIEIVSISGRFHDILNRFYLYVRDRL